MVARTGDTISGIARNASGMDWVQQLKAANTRANPWLMAAGQVAQSYGMGKLGRMAPISEGDLLDSTINQSGAWGDIDQMAKAAMRSKFG